MSPRNASEQGQRRSYVYRGQQYPSVTTLLKSYPQEWAIAYGAKHVAERALSLEAYQRLCDIWEYSRSRADELRPDVLRWLKAAPFERRDAAADAGTIRHGYLEDRLNGLAKPDGDLSPAEYAVEQFLDAYRPDPLYVEAQVVSVAEGYAGSADAFVRIYGKTYILDLKSSGTYDPMADRPSKAGGDHKDRLQLAAYRYADIVYEDDRDLGPVPACDGAAILAIPRDHPQAWQLIEVQAGPAEHRRFLKFARCWSWYDANKDEPIGSHVLPQVEEGAA